MRVVLVTGSSSGIGKAIAQRFLLDGDCVFVNGANDSESLCNVHKDAHPILCDVSDYESTSLMFDKITAVAGPIDVLVNNAGISFFGLFSDMSPKEWQRIMDVNFNSVLNCTHLALPSMLKSHKGVIVNISSVWGQDGASCEAVYSASKGAIDSFSKAMGKELAMSGIRVNAVSCGVIKTRMNARLTCEETDALIDEIPMGRMGKPDEVAELVHYLASDSASYITGEVIRISGGF